MTKSILSLLVLAGLLHTASAAESFHWPGGAKAAVSLAYDDAAPSQLDHALPTLNKYGLRGTFYLTLSSPTVDKRLAEWRAAAAQGHELANHSLFHQCRRSQPEREWVEPHRNLDTTTAAQMRDQVALANTMLYAIDGRRERTFTAPCGDLLAAGVNYLPALHGDFVAIKASVADGPVQAMDALDPYRVPVFSPVNQTGAQLIALVKQAGERGTMIAFTFHGIGGDYLTNSSAAHEELVRYLAEHRDEYWIDTFLNIMRHVKANR
ncbi:peptidoglycan/xylan/chitin deacetylase (PgdA/CDA1 family) [Pseudoduganella flava]|uniref:Peptidoglycan/xylan/chitin deacetylase (PgdA/CDA1 family) n=1 Tax=Pseudoduganella flava TaxID=871742 RepID=A0A562PGV1_9BURK|nr:polysaccharide deacetylase family protein [Pseudoduganella flava]QGZ40370.1 polysaccharide deacetylase family protein [Pseudoduganella flava]TWI43563.1 peptidoglycan/xylan/chitin deacetylase (PgdA/CDA1 family) [Pseudoduganella flava]